MSGRTPAEHRPGSARRTTLACAVLLTAGLLAARAGAADLAGPDELRRSDLAAAASRPAGAVPILVVPGCSDSERLLRCETREDIYRPSDTGLIGIEGTIVRSGRLPYPDNGEFFRR